MHSNLLPIWRVNKKWLLAQNLKLLVSIGSERGRHRLVRTQSIHLNTSFPSAQSASICRRASIFLQKTPQSFCSSDRVKLASVLQNPVHHSADYLQNDACNWLKIVAVKSLLQIAGAAFYIYSRRRQRIIGKCDKKNIRENQVTKYAS